MRDGTLDLFRYLAERSITLAEKEAEIAKTQTVLAATTSELTTVKDTLTKATQAAETDKARKAYQVTSKFDLAINLNKHDKPQDLDAAFASFFLTGK